MRIDEEILNYDYVNMELRIFGTRVYLNPDLVSQATKIPRRGEDIFISLETPKPEKNLTANQICKKIAYVPMKECRMSLLEYTNR